MLDICKFAFYFAKSSRDNRAAAMLLSRGGLRATARRPLFQSKESSLLLRSFSNSKATKSNYKFHPWSDSKTNSKVKSKANSSFQISTDEAVADVATDHLLGPRWNGFSAKQIRSLFYVPGSSKKMLEKAWTLKVDNIVIAPFRSRIPV